jgi:SAM-dependent methyltransferase
MNPADYDAWYDTPRGRWVGETEYALAARCLKTLPGDSLLDVGCGTGWFTRRAAADGLHVTGLDPNSAWLDYARAHSKSALDWVEGDARDLPFSDASFDHVLSIAALCFIDGERQAVAECVRVARRRFAIGWLNRNSLLYRQKGRDGGSGAYRGARWHSADEVRALFAGLPVRKLACHAAIFLPSASIRARRLERALPSVLPWGGLLLVTGEKA